uniref:Nudix hydrolase domain-containing protein n=1 Tax=Ditylenchus dipsaci TaxID=166011 RepID=A0A915E0M0_9BILA
MKAISVYILLCVVLYVLADHGNNNKNSLVKKVAEAIKSKTDKLFSKGPLSCLSIWVAACNQVGFELHMVDKIISEGKPPLKVIYMQKWFDSSIDSTYRDPAFTTIGLGAIVVNENNEYLLFDEDSTYVTGVRTLTDGGKMIAGKSLLPGETIENGIKRILEQKTKVAAKNFDFHAVLEFKHSHTPGVARRGKGDMFIYCLLTCKKHSHIESKTQHYWLPRDKISEDDLRTIGNRQAIDAAEVFLTQHKEKISQYWINEKDEIEQKIESETKAATNINAVQKEIAEKFKLYRVDIEKANALTYVFYPNKNFFDHQNKSEPQEKKEDVNLVAPQEIVAE